MAEGGNNNGGPRKQYLHMTIHEAWGVSKEQEPVWDDQFTEGYVRVEVRGGPKVQKFTTYTQKVENYAMNWRQDMKVELTEQSKELRIMLCKEKPRDPSVRRHTSVIAACGIFVNDILEAVPIDKAFELFKPGDQDTSLGGYIRVTLRTGPKATSVPPIQEDEAIEAREGIENRQDQTSPEDIEGDENTGPGGGRRALKFVCNILLVAGIAASIIVFKNKTQKQI